MLEIGRMTQVDGLYEFRDASRSLIVRGAHPEWVLQAAAEVIGNFSRLEQQSLVEEMTALTTLGAVDHVELTATRSEYRHRFETSPRCHVALGSVDYFWAAQEGPRLKPDDIAVTPLTLGPEMLVGQRAG